MDSRQWKEQAKAIIRRSSTEEKPASERSRVAPPFASLLGFSLLFG